MQGIAAKLPPLGADTYLLDELYKQNCDMRARNRGEVTPFGGRTLTYLTNFISKIVTCVQGIAAKLPPLGGGHLLT